MGKKKDCCITVIVALLFMIGGIGCGKTDVEEELWQSEGSIEMSGQDYFSGYNGERIQRVISEDGNVYSPARCNDVIFYWADAGETLEDVLAEMKRAILKPLTAAAEDRPFTVTSYNVDEQAQIYCLAPARELPEEFAVPQWVSEYEWGEAAEEVWLLPTLEGYYCFEGTDLVSMNILLESEESQDGMVSFVTQGSEEAFQFILMRRGNVYRLQRAEKLKEVLVLLQRDESIP